MKKLALFVCLLATACERTTRETPVIPPEGMPQSAAPTVVEVDPDADNVLSLAYGASVVSRTGEMNLETSAAHLIDNLPPTAWVSPPGAAEEKLVFSLLSPTRLNRVGITVSKSLEVPRRLAFDVSTDGKKWRELIVVTPENENSRQLWPIEPTVARYIRLRTLDTVGMYYVRARTIHALGDEIEPPATPPFTGCWTVNGRPAFLLQQGARITGRIDTEPPIEIEGGTDNRVALVTWRQDGAWGHAALTRTPDGRHLTGLRFFEEFDVVHVGDAWFGDRCQAAVPASIPARPPRMPHPLYGLSFDAQGNLIEELSAPQLDALVPLLATSQHMRITSHEVRHDTPEENRRHTAARIASLRSALQARGVNLDRIELVAAGNDWRGPVLHTTLQQLFASRVELSFGR